MRKSFLFLSLLSVFAMAACNATASPSSSVTPPPPASTSQVEPTSSATSAPTSTTSEDTRQFTLSFDASGGTGTMDGITTNKASGFKVTVPACTFVKEGANFLCWSEEDGTARNVGEELTLTANLKLYANWDNINYTVTFYDEDEETVIDQKDDYNYGDTLVKPADPTKEGTAQYSYTFIGWNKEVPEKVTKDLTFVATYEQTVNKYTVKFVNGDEVLQSEQLDYGAAPTYKEAMPTKNPTEQYEYEFKGWDKDITSVTGDATYEATFTPTVRSYHVSWVDYDGTELGSEEVKYGTVPTHENPSRPADNTYTYEFNGWDPEVVAVTDNAEYKATYTPTYIDYAVAFESNGGSPVVGANYHYGDKIVKPTDPSKAAAEFLGWYKESSLQTLWNFEEDTVSGATTLYAKWSDDKYTVTFNSNGGSEVASISDLVSGSKIDAPANPSKDHYTFGGWYKEDGLEHAWVFDTDEVTGNITLYAKWTPVKYTITWKNGDTTLDTDEVDYNTMPSYTGDTPTKEATAQYTYTFNGWDPAVAVVSGDATYNATFTETEREYTITWKDDTGTTIDTTKVNYGVVPTHANPSKAATAQYTYTFTGWTPVVVAVAGDAEYTATFGSTVNTYTVVWKNYDDTVLETDQNVEYGTKPTYNGETPTKPSTVEYNYTFTGWDPEVKGDTIVTGNIEYTAQFNGTKVQYAIRWLNYDGTVLEDDGTVPHGASPTYNGDTPTRPATAQYTYTFTGWAPEVHGVTGAQDYVAQYSTTVNKYTVTFNTNGGTPAIDSQEVEYGTNVTTPEEVTKTGHTFGGWFDNSECTGDAWNFLTNTVTGTTTLYAKWTANAYNVTYKDQGNVDYTGDAIDSSYNTYTYGTGLTLPTGSKTGYTFGGWYVNSDCSGDAVTTITTSDVGDKTYYAKWTIQKYTITIASNNGGYGSVNVTEIANVEYGTAVTKNGNTITIGETVITATPSVNTPQFNYAFDNWSGVDDTITGVTTITANFTVTELYTLWISTDGGNNYNMSNIVSNVPQGRDDNAVFSNVTLGNGNKIYILYGSVQVGDILTVSFDTSRLSNVYYEAGVNEYNQPWAHIQSADSVYRLRGIINGGNYWNNDYTTIKFVINPAVIDQSEFMLSEQIFLAAGDKIKVVHAGATEWYPDGEGTEYTVTNDGYYQIYFRPGHKYDSGWHWDYFSVSLIKSVSKVVVAPTEGDWEHETKTYSNIDYASEDEILIEGVSLTAGNVFYIKMGVNDYTGSQDRHWQDLNDAAEGNIHANFTAATNGNDIKVLVDGTYDFFVKKNSDGDNSVVIKLHVSE